MGREGEERGENGERRGEGSITGNSLLMAKCCASKLNIDAASDFPRKLHLGSD